MPAHLMVFGRLCAAFVVVVAFSSGCVPRCERVCDKLLQCGEVPTDRFSHQECEDSCARQALLFDGWEDEKQLEKANNDQRHCIVDSTCEEIADGVCYDERLYPFECEDC